MTNKSNNSFKSSLAAFCHNTNKYRWWLIAAALSAAISASMQGCKSPLDLEPPLDNPTAVALGTTENVESVLNSAYNSMQNAAALGGNLRILPEAVADHATINPFAVERGIVPLNLQNTYRRTLFATADGTWRTCYQAINRANNVIFAIQTGTVTNKDAIYNANKDRQLGEALFIRGIMHFELCRLFGLQYGEPGYDDEFGQRGVILLTTPTENRVGLARSSTKQVYDQVIADLTESIRLLPSASSDLNSFLPVYGGRVGGKATKEAAQAYLARVFFQMGTVDGNNKALEVINQVLPQSPADTSFYLNNVLDRYTRPDGQEFLNTDITPWNIRGFQVAKEAYFQIVNTVEERSATFNSSAGLITNVYTWIGEGSVPAFFLNSQRFADSANFNDRDLRRRLLLRPVPAEFIGLRCPITRERNLVVAKYFFRSLPAPFSPNIGVVNIQVIRAAELILNRAEINFYLGNEDMARQDILLLQKRAQLPLGLQAATQNATGAALLSIIRRERIRELCFEGDRFYNLKRMERVFQNGITGSRGVAESLDKFIIRSGRDECERTIDVASPNSPLLLFQIPDDELSSNPNIRRN